MYPPSVIHALKDTLRKIYWYKDDLRRFLLSVGVPSSIIAKQGWHDPQEYKVQIAGKVIDDLIALGDEGLGSMRGLIQGVLDIENFDHLKELEDGAAKVSAARIGVEALRDLVERHDSSFRKEREYRNSRAASVAEAVRRRNNEIQRLHVRFNALIITEDEQQRGQIFERFLYDLFVAHDLYPRSPFRVVGEQIDGAFEFEGTQFLLEAKWVKAPVGAAPLDSFSRKVERKLENTLGLFIALNGFTQDGLIAFTRTRPSVILMDGQDLAIVLQGLMDFLEMLKRKIRHASQTGDPFLRGLE